MRDSINKEYDCEIAADYRQSPEYHVDYDSWIEGNPPDGEVEPIDANQAEFERQAACDPNSSDWD